MGGMPRGGKKRGRPTTRTEAITAKLIGLLEEGISARSAARMIGLSPSTLMSWIKRDVDFRIRYLRARRVGIAALREYIVQAYEPITARGLEMMERARVGNTSRDELKEARREAQAARHSAARLERQLGVFVRHFGG